MFREPWFSIIDVCDVPGRSMADIAAEVAAEHGMSLTDIRGVSRRHKVCKARQEAWRRINKERLDISSGQIAMYFGREGSTVRHLVRETYVLRRRAGFKAVSSYTRAWSVEERDRVATALRCGATRKEIAKMFGVSYNAARKRIYRDETLRGLAA